MKRTILALLVVIASLGTAALWNREGFAMNVKLHAKDLPEHGLKIITPSDPSFDGKVMALLKGQTSDKTEALKPYSVIIENRGNQNVVAYMIEWCYTGADGKNECRRSAYVNPIELMEGGLPLPEVMEEQSDLIKPNKSRLFYLVNPDGSGSFRVPVSREEAEQIKAGAGINIQAMRQRYHAELAKFTDITVSLDGVFFDDGTFVGPDTTGFFDMVKAEVVAKRDLLSDIALGLSQLHKSKDEVFRHVQKIANQPDVDIGSGSTPTEFYHFYQKSYADQILRVRAALGDDDKTLTITLRPLKKEWRKLRKKQKTEDEK
ncbi:MAG TPA: hypothetical protein VM934_06535 [Pyrinomonadaceae bacterium]|jgi:hypothetical protein|nr:hypothetical protein [Pyrinomonadaceae bacterium]